MEAGLESPAPDSAVSPEVAEPQAGDDEPGLMGAVPPATSAPVLEPGDAILDDIALVEDDLGIVDRIEVRDRFGARARLGADRFVALVHDAVVSHPQWSSSAAEAEIAGFAVDEARAGLFPQIDLGLTGSATQFSNTRSDLSGTSRDKGFETDADVYVRARQLIFDAGATFDRIAQGEAEQAAGRLTQESTGSALAVDAISSYYEVLAFTMLVRLGEEHLANLAQLEDMVDARREGGGGDLGDLAEVRAERANAETHHVSLRRRLSDARNRYRELFGENAPEMLPWPDFRPVVPATREDALSTAIAVHPAMAAAREKVRAGSLGLSAIEAERMPGLRFEVDGARYDMASDPVDGVSMRLVGSLKLYDGGLSDAREGRAAAQLRKARFDEMTAMRTIERRTGAAFDALQLMEAETRAADGALAATAASRVATRERFEAVGGNLLNVLNAEVDAHGAAIAWVEVMVNREISRFRLLEASGGLASYFGLEVTP
ncbi:TolC family protein [Zavarzinia compransoris]|uniref:TolC family protein n=1 Tax=Zavarzinia marina TaxID=2911065 RepID=UPI001F2861D1|nr:TolC family protein [Zavarzinia marina]MCF4164693.1 TolC family protein [Zavarzinia marina]